MILKKARKPFVKLKFGPNWSYISTVRNFIVNFLAITIEDNKKADLIAMAVNELIENAIKYSDREGIEISLRFSKNKRTIHAKVINHLKKKEYLFLKKFLREMLEEPPLEAYIKRMKAGSLTQSNKSMIGLARIRHETGAKIKCGYKHGYVKVTALFPDIDIKVTK